MNLGPGAPEVRDFGPYDFGPSTDVGAQKSTFPHHKLMNHALTRNRVYGELAVQVKRIAMASGTADR